MEISTCSKRIKEFFWPLILEPGISWIRLLRAGLEGQNNFGLSIYGESRFRKSKPKHQSEKCHRRREDEDEDEEDWPGAGGYLQAPTRGQYTRREIRRESPAFGLLFWIVIFIRVFYDDKAPSVLILAQLLQR